MSVIARFPAVCPFCSKPIKVGMEIKPHPRASRWVHASCAGGGTQQRLFK